MATALIFKFQLISNYAGTSASDLVLHSMYLVSNGDGYEEALKNCHLCLAGNVDENGDPETS